MSVFRSKATASSGATEAVESGTYPAVLIALVDLGTHQEEYEGKISDKRKCVLVWELVEEKMSGSTMNHMLSKEFTLSHHLKSGLAAFAGGMRGKAYSDGEEIAYDAMLGVPCLLAVEQAQSKQTGRKFAKVKSASRPMKGATVPKPGRPLTIWSVEDGDIETLERADLPFLYGEALHEVAKRSKELKGGGTSQPSTRRGNEGEIGSEDTPF